MKQALLKNLEDYRCAPGISARGLTIIPVTRAEAGCSENYLSLHQAFKSGVITVTEVNQGGSVPNLKVINRGKLPVLILDGEELRGAKQNRILNASVLVPADSELVIPVSCTEAGRWSYHKPDFEESGNVIAASMKPGKMDTVSQNLKHSVAFQADQSAVWHDVEHLQRRMGTRSRTSAMADVYEAQRENLDEFEKIFRCEELAGDQCGILVEKDGSFAGLELVSHPAIWLDVRDKIIRSYAIEVINRPQGERRQVEAIGNEIDRLFENIALEGFKSVGLGDDLRIEKPDLVGSALVWEEQLVHLAAYPRLARREEVHYHSPRFRS
jgi:hypothetical protein